jgi:rod shape-determining protein MreD
VTDLSQTRLWLMRGAFLLLVVVILFFRLLPLGTAPKSWAGPDLLLAFACAWSLRRPEYVPPVSLAVAFLLADFLLQRPPGLWALLALLGCENLKGRVRSLRDSGFASELVAVALVITVITLAERLVMAVVMLEPPQFSLSLSELVLTLLFYPLIVGITHWLMGVRKSAPGDLDALGQRS